ncbi:MAG: NUDIX hydrolase [Lachnospiraceae bacterium]|nr:NUDIX hydrolase [Lachnospiraceae bacterium]
MSKINKITQVTQNRFLNMFEMDVEDNTGHPFKYYMASREKNIDSLMINTKKLNSNGVCIFAVKQEEVEKVVMVRQYRFPLDDYIYELPAGLVEAGEDYHDAGARELKEETGLTFNPVRTKEGFTRPYFNSCGMSDETNATVFGTATGSVSTEGLEQTENLSVVLVDRGEARRILREENIAIMGAYMLMYFINSEEGHALDAFVE